MISEAERAIRSAASCDCAQGTREHVQTCASMFKHVQACSNMCKHVQTCASMFKNAQTYANTRSAREHNRTHTNTQTQRTTARGL
eukprot:2513067-Pleurochrysis_carterae.AAC.1